MKQNPNTRNIFTKQGRLNRLIDKHNKTLQLIDKMKKILNRLDEKYDSMEIPLDEINEEVYGIEEEIDECVISCDKCNYEFNICDENIEKIEVNKTTEDGSSDIVKKFICPKCEFANEVEYDDDEEYEHSSEDNELSKESLEESINIEETDVESNLNDDAIEEDPIIKKYEDLYSDDQSCNKEKIIKKNNKEICIKNGNIK